MVRSKGLVNILLDLENSKADLKAEMQMEENSAQNTAAMLNTSLDVIITLDSVLESLGALLREFCTEAMSDKSERCRVESLLWSEKQRIKLLELSLAHSSLTAGHAMDECNRLFKQVLLFLNC
jgi:hypothetical protein